MTLHGQQVQRYARHILLPDVGGRGQERLLGAAVAVPVGPERAAEVAALVYLAAAGVGTLVVAGEATGPLTAGECRAGLAYGAADVGRPRLDALRERIGAINPDVSVVADDPHGRARPLATSPARPDAGPGTEVADALVAGGSAAMQTITELLRSDP